MKARLALGGALLLAACETPEPDRDLRLKYEAGLAAESAAAANPGAADTLAPDSALLAAIRRSAGIAGVTAVHVERGTRLSVRGGEAFPSASTFKLPVALAVLARVDSGRMALADSVGLAPSDFRIGPSQIADSVGAAGGRTTVGRLIQSMMIYSDNTATDRLTRMLGGPAVVDAHLRSRGIRGVRVDRTEGEVHWEYGGVRDVPPAAAWSRDEFNRRLAAVPAAEKEAAHERFFADPRDTSSPDGVAALLVQLQRGDGISAASRDFVLRAMAASPTGAERIRAGVPAGTPVADKTGTIGRSTNDVGIITLPDGSHVALAVFIRQSTRDNAGEEKVIAEIARAVYNRFAASPSR